MKLKHLLLASASSFLLFNGASYAQSVKNYGCYTDEHNRELEALYPQLVQNRQAFEHFYQQQVAKNPQGLKTNGTTIKIPVVVHIVTENGLTGISKAQVLNGLEVLNNDFNLRNADTTSGHRVFRSYRSDLGIEFVMAKKDPNGDPTEGIDRVTSLITNGPNGPNARDNVKLAAPAWDPNKYFNVWLVQTINSDGLQGGGSILGYAQFPDNTALNTYGLVALHSEWGKQGAVPGSTARTDGRTATHEVGHCFNLFHTFQDGCTGPNHTQTGDRVGDTPPAATATYLTNCNNTQNSCSTDTGAGSAFSQDMQDMTENYMSYDQCQNMFTKGQKARVVTAMGFYPHLVNIQTQATAIATGIDPSVTIGPLKPKAYFGVTSDHVCVNQPITITDASYNGTATSWNWSFPGGTPSTSTDQNPTVTYSTPGVYTVTLKAGNAAGDNTFTQTNFIHVTPVTGLDNVAVGKQFVEDFEDTNFPNNTATNKVWERYTSGVAGTPSWEQTPSGSTSGIYSMRLRNSTIGSRTLSTLISPNINISGLGSAVNFSFDLAYAPKTSSTAELLEVYASSDCGLNWTRQYSKGGAQLITTSPASTLITSNFIPASNQWRTETKGLTPNVLSSGTIMFKIVATSKDGNYLYIDNFRVFSTVTGGKDDVAENHIAVYPNPVTTETGINFEMRSTEKVSVKIFDIVGNMVYQGSETTFAPGKHSISLYDKMKSMKAGMYMVQMNLGNKTFNTKLIAQ